MQTRLQTELGSILNHQGSLAVSLFLPTGHINSAQYDMAYRLRNLLHQVEQELPRHAIGEARIADMLKPAYKLPDAPELAISVPESIALYLSDGVFQWLPLPLTLPEKISIGHRFDIKPLLPLLSGDGEYYVLALSHNAVKLLRCTRDIVEEAPLRSGTPHSLAEAMQYDEPERQLQLHSGGPGRTATFHGKEIDREDDKERLRRFFRCVDQGLPPELRQGSSPLILAGVEYLFPIYHEANTYVHLLVQGVTGNVDRCNDAIIHERSWQLVAPLFQQPAREEWKRFEELNGTGPASADVADIVQTSFHGRISALFVDIERPQWGAFDSYSQSVHLHPTREAGDEDLANLAVIETLLHGGGVYAVMPEQAPAAQPLAATFRY